MVKLRLRRRGRKRLPVYDIVAADIRSPRDGRHIERIGQYNPLITSGATMLDRERAIYWLNTGAQPTDTVKDILSREGVLLELTMGKKGASVEEITAAVEAHVSQVKTRESKQGDVKAAAAAEKARAEAEAIATAEAEAAAAAEVEKAAAEKEAAEAAAAAAATAEAATEAAPADEGKETEASEESKES